MCLNEHSYHSYVFLGLSSFFNSDVNRSAHLNLTRDKYGHVRSLIKVDQAGRPLPHRTLSILVGLTLNLDSLCTIVNIVGNFWTFA